MGRSGMGSGRSSELNVLSEQLEAGALSRRQFVVRALALGLSATAAGTLLAACGGGESSSGTGGSSGGKALNGTVQILVGYFGTGNQPAQAQVQEALATAYTQLHAGVKIEFLRVPSSSDAQTKLVALSAAGAPPDLVMPTGIYGTSLFLDEEIWLNLEDLLKRDGLTLDAYSPVTAVATHQPNYYGTSATGVVGLPVGLNTHAIAYNPALFSAAGLPMPPTSWTDASWTYEGAFLNAAKALTLDGRGRHPGDAGFDPSTVRQFGLGHFFRETLFFAFGGKYYDPGTRKATMASAGGTAGLQFASDLVNLHRVQPSRTVAASLGAGGGQGNEELFMWKNGQLAMIDMGTSDISSYGTGTPFEFSLAAMPAGPARRFNFLNLDVGAVVKASKNTDLAWEVLKYFSLDPAASKRLAFDSYNEIPALKQNTEAFSTGVRASLPKADPKVWIDGFEFAGADNEAWFPAFAEVNSLVGKAFDSIVDGRPAASVLPQLQGTAQTEIDKWFSSHQLPR
ncbi:MAG: hypothetical protein AVDCRST_MAG50-1346 [uncultured Acidimicrobiales bacterium]|uniref:ABC transporter, substrate-binding protein (Cluster 1, maltose/g3p/polyamine/iron) n=1 Tax=uncultured Acidimicrobiales bacterium TaxID=310071 RepID=A0A6J4HUX4_9ACTN|nr:MAG: hypothetical protein AVDCRST_MAG50-1346 [uncultured Acidimicrobiales bacterium]